MAAEVAQVAVATTEENISTDATKTAAAVEETAAVTKNEQKSDEPTKNNAENHSGDAVTAAAAKVIAPKVIVHKADFEKDIIYLYQFSRTPLLPSLSPYCLKVETWLRLTGLKYEVSFFCSQFFFYYLYFLLLFLLNYN